MTILANRLHSCIFSNFPKKQHPPPHPLTFPRTGVHAPIQTYIPIKTIYKSTKYEHNLNIKHLLMFSGVRCLDLSPVPCINQIRKYIRNYAIVAKQMYVCEHVCVCKVYES